MPEMVVAFSGGVDSTALGLALVEAEEEAKP